MLCYTNSLVPGTAERCNPIRVLPGERGRIEDVHIDRRPRAAACRALFFIFPYCAARICAKERVGREKCFKDSLPRDSAGFLSRNLCAHVSRSERGSRFKFNTWEPLQRVACACACVAVGNECWLSSSSSSSSSTHISITQQNTARCKVERWNAAGNVFIKFEFLVVTM